MSLKRTSLYDTHIQAKGRMVPYAGFEMPVQYTSIIEEHLKVRSKCGLFDVSHMGEIRVSGKNSIPFLERITPNHVTGQQDGQIRYNVILNESGGIVDDITIEREAEDSYLLIVNASNTEKVWQYLNKQDLTDVKIENESDNYSLLALQGPLAESILAKHSAFSAALIANLRYFHFTDVSNIRLSRTGYTGEDGFELMCTNDRAVLLWQELIDIGGSDISPVGLGARDSLRLEARYPLYGHELTDDRTAIESGIGFIVKEKNPPYLQMQKIIDQKKNGSESKITGFMLEESGIARDGMQVLIDGKVAGTVQSGGFSPVLKKGIGTAFLPSAFVEAGRPVEILIRDRPTKAKLHTTAFVKGTAGKKN